MYRWTTSPKLSGIVLVSLICAPLMMLAAGLVERRLGPSAAGWVAALPVVFMVGVVVVAVDRGGDTAGRLTASACAHVPAQVAFGVVFAAALRRGGLLRGCALGVGVYAVGSAAVAGLPQAAALAASVPALAVAPRLVRTSGPRPASPRTRASTAMSCAAASAAVGAVVLVVRLAGPTTAGAIAAFPTISTVVAIAAARRDGAAAGAHALVGLLRSLPCFLTLRLVASVALPALGPAAVALAVLGCLAVAGTTWRGVPLAPRPATRT